MKNSIFNFSVIVLLVAFAACGDTNNKVDAAAQEKAMDVAMVKTLRQKLAFRPDSSGIRYQLMNALAKTGDYKGALLQNDTLLLNDNANAPVWFRRGMILLQRGDTIEAVPALERASAEAPMFAEPKLQLASLYADQSDAKALSITDTLLRYAAETNVATQARFIKGLYYSNTNNKEKAIAQFDECIKNDYTFLEAYVEKGLLLYDLKNYAEALAVFEKSITVSNTFAEGYYQAGRCKEAMGDKAGAKDYYEKALALDKSLDAAKITLKNL